MKAAVRKTVGRAAKRTNKRTVRPKKTKNPVFHHALLKTARMQEMIAWYAAVVVPSRYFRLPELCF